MLKLREATNEYIGANLDPSHLWWQGIDPIAAIRILAKQMQFITSMLKIRILIKKM